MLAGDLKPGDRVITAGQYKVQDGSLVADPHAAHTAQAETAAPGPVGQGRTVMDMRVAGGGRDAA